MPMIFFLFLTFWLNDLVFTDHEHKFYVSTTSIEWKPTSKSLQITTQLFTDDIQSILSQHNQSIYLDPDSDTEVINQLIINYFKKTLIFTFDGIPISYAFLGKEYVKDITKCFMELKFKEVPNKIKLSNELFLSLFEDQQNIVHFKSLDQRKSYLLHKNKRSVLLTLKP
jgi:hypothetical protein